MQLRKATRTKSKLRIGLAGTSGSGKTYSALLLASGMAAWDKIAVIDTENGSADLYTQLGEYNVITLQAPFSPERYIEAIKTCEDAGMEVIIVDSITHEWDGKGGCLEIIEQVTKASTSKNSYTAWAKVTPRHNAFVQAILQSSAHVITTVRRKQDYSMDKNDQGKTVVTKAGLKEVTRDGFEYELTLSFALSQNHLAEASKDRTSLFMDKPEFVITAETGKLLKSWAEEGLDHLPVPMITPDQIKLLHTLITKKGADKAALLDYFGVKSSKDLSEEQAAEAIKILQKRQDKPEMSDEETEKVVDSIPEDLE